MVAIDHRFLLGQSVQARRSDGNWHAAVIIDANIHHPDQFWNPPHENDTIRVIFADRITKSYRLQQDLSSVLSPIVWTEGLVARRKEELFQTLPPEIDEHRLPLPQDLEASQEEMSSCSGFNSAALEEHCRNFSKPVKRQLSVAELKPPPKKSKKRGSNQPLCLESDDDIDDETYQLACQLSSAAMKKQGRMQ